MASTRSKNTPGNYCLEQREYSGSQNYTLYPNSQYGAAYDTRLPGTGLLPGQIPGNQMSKNTPDIESFLFGINSTNLVNPAPAFTPELKNLCSANVFKKGPIYIPEPLVIEGNQRPFPVPN
jgi:hypothetical protein|uniref:Uncharacterized protein n=1 Tax=viral metagenome TaxID=1070528 RepID=A0A6C0DGK4_9ZZZZ